MHRIAISGLVALAAVLGGGAVSATAMAQHPTAAAARPTTAGWADSVAAVRAGRAVAMRTARTAVAAYQGQAEIGEPLISCVLATDCLGVEGASSQSVRSALLERRRALATPSCSIGSLLSRIPAVSTRVTG